MTRMAGPRQLADRWKVEPWRTVDEQIVEFCREQATAPVPWADPDTGALFALLDGLPFGDEVPSGRDLRASSFPGGANMDLRDTDCSYCREIVSLEQCDLTGARFDHARGEIGRVAGKVVRASFHDARLPRAWLTHSVFSECDFSEAVLKSAMLRSSDLRGSSFAAADCRGADFQESDLRGCSFAGADLSGAMFRAVILDETTDLRGATLVDVTADALYDNRGRLVLGGTDLDRAGRDESTVTGSDPGAVDREILDLVVEEATREGEPWAERLVADARAARLRLERDPSFRWYDALVEGVDAFDRPRAEALIQRASLRL
jgi:uncharacterized protein YjbI with pentapeptide repeats